MATNLDTLLKQHNKAGPYQKSVRVLVTGVHPAVEYQSDGQTKKAINCVVADDTRAAKVAVFNEAKFARFKDGTSLILRNVIVKPETQSLTVTSRSQVFPSAPVEVESTILDEASRLFSPPPAEVTSIDKALASPVKTKVSIMGQIMKEEAVQKVSYRKQKIDVKNIYVKDESKPDGCRVALWREATQTTCRPGDFVQITDLVINTYRNDISLQTTSQSTVKQTEPPVEEQEFAVSSGYVEGSVLNLLDVNDEVAELPVVLFDTLVSEPEDLEDYILKKCNPTFTMKIVRKGSNIISVDMNN